jgi:hypothetical protein
MALSRGKATIVAPVTNALAPVLTIIISLIVYQTLPSVFGFIGIILAIGGSTLMVYADESDSGAAATDVAGAPGTAGLTGTPDPSRDDAAKTATKTATKKEGA